MDPELIQALSLFVLSCVVVFNTVVLNRMVKKIALVLTLMRKLSATAGEIISQKATGSELDLKNTSTGNESRSSELAGGSQSRG